MSRTIPGAPAGVVIAVGAFRGPPGKEKAEVAGAAAGVVAEVARVVAGIDVLGLVPKRLPPGKVVGVELVVDGFAPPNKDDAEAP